MRPALWPAFGMALLLAACGSSPPAPIEDRTRPEEPTPREYRVTRGDTLYSIAFRYGLDYRRVAAANNIRAPYTIFPGQRLRLAEAELSSTPAARTGSRTSVSTGSTAAASLPPAASSAPGVGTAPGIPAPEARSDAAAKVGTSPATRKPAAATPLPKADGWNWPNAGKVTRRFDTTLHKGIDIAGARGDPVYATAPGRVVYAGSGMAGYGLLVILRHDSDYLSAYGHNDALLVSEGDTVRAGQIIARMGNSGTDSVKLHFELRLRGKPVDPLAKLGTRH